MTTLSYADLMPVLDTSEAEDATLYLLDNDVFGPTSVLIYHEDTHFEECYILSDMQGLYPHTFDEVPEYVWSRADDVSF